MMSEKYALTWDDLSAAEKQALIHIDRLGTMPEETPECYECVNRLITALELVAYIPASQTLTPGKAFTLTEAGQALLPIAEGVTWEGLTGVEQRALAFAVENRFVRGVSKSGALDFDEWPFAVTNRLHEIGVLTPFFEGEPDPEYTLYAPTKAGRGLLPKAGEAARTYTQEEMDDANLKNQIATIFPTLGDVGDVPEPPFLHVIRLENKIASLQKELAAANERAEAAEREVAQLLRWLYANMINTAQDCLRTANEVAVKGAWPAGQTWNDLGDSSRSTFLHQARDRMHISHDEFLPIIRAHADDVDDIYENGLNAL